jgi:uncharacterized protein (TIGR02118 family)
MIHRMVFVVPKPGMDEQGFFRYWKEVHAPLGAAIPQVLGYRICTRVECPAITASHPFVGAADIWIRDETAALAFARSREYVDGVRPDEPKWLAFWQMVVLDTTSHVLVGDPAPGASPGGVKFLALFKRRHDLSLDRFRDFSLNVHVDLNRCLPGLRRYVQGHVLDSWYEVGEPPFDCVSQLWFDDVEAALDMLASPENGESARDLANFVAPARAHVLLTREFWVVGPQFRS